MSEAQLRKEFARVDKDNDGTITIEELRKYYTPMQEMLGISKQLAEQEIRGLIKRLDVDDSGTISFEGTAARLFPISIEIQCAYLFRIQTISVQKLDPASGVTFVDIWAKSNFNSVMKYEEKNLLLINNSRYSLRRSFCVSFMRYAQRVSKPYGNIRCRCLPDRYPRCAWS